MIMGQRASTKTKAGRSPENPATGQASVHDCFDNIPAGLFRSTLEGRLVHCNQSFAELFGYESSKALKDFPVINLYQHKRDRGAMVQAVLKQGQVTDLPILFKKRDGSAIWCCFSAKVVFDDDGMAMLLDGLVRPTPGHWPASTGILGPDANAADNTSVVDNNQEALLVASLDLKGRIIDINGPGLALFKLPGEAIYGRQLMSLVDPGYKDLYLLFLSDLFRLGHQETLLRVKDANGRQHQLALQASLVTHEGRPHHIKAIARDVTDQDQRRQRALEQQKLKGVLEMAGGVAHRMSQPLTIITNIVEEIAKKRSETISGQDGGWLVRLSSQVQELNDLIHKVKRINSYATTEYVDGQTIVDLDRSSGAEG
jgi:PAS domain S-box-containing protein